MVIPAVDYINDVFMPGILDQQCLNPAIHAALMLRKRTLNKYYSLTDVSKLYWIAMVLHPLHKLEYFKQAKWEVAWIDGAHDLVRNTYNLSYASCYINNDMDLMSDCGASGSEGHSTNIFDSLPSLTKRRPAHGGNELNTYLMSSIKDIDPADALMWWHKQHSLYPHLSCVVLDYLTVPGMHIINNASFCRINLFQQCLLMSNASSVTGA
ncbi:hypothetical protein PISMIDRAFT_108170 [Pisolithus microcarpus 441]|uniref:Unplaced genomic scaffold scaffold_105, whole genome shotgun sequence n=1 Tax=Pisolithus microcarpus 441 TaxID=765257 RepID=A0A0C9YYZ1_9AGAM|nr:hypothetical protein PISMIDRAFT_108170 [Pisolithus microcarpus 441]